MLAARPSVSVIAALLAAPCSADAELLSNAAEQTADPEPAVAVTDLYERGKELASEERWQEALDLWSSATDSLPVGVSDPRIGPAFIAAAIRSGAEDRLGEASSLYLWSFTGDVPGSLSSFILEEARRIVPILPRRDSISWQDHIPENSDDDPERYRGLAHRIARFWIERDPTPDTPLNERLVEHWRRIVEARSRFVRHNRSPYRTDDRGTVFVKFGPPDDAIGGTLGGSEAELRIRVTDREWMARMRRLDPHPDFALWRYRDLNPFEMTYFLFGNVRGSGPFELVRGPLDLVSDQARARGSRNLTPGGVRGQYYLELFYYHDLAVLGGHYSKRFGELSDLWDGYTLRRNVFGANGRPSPTGPTLETYSIRYEQEDRYHPPGAPVVRAKSDFEGSSRATELVLQAVRVLDAENRPNVVFQSLAAPRLVLDGHGDRRRAFMTPIRDTRHVLLLRDRTLREAGRTSRDAPAASGGIAVFRLFHPDQPMHVSVYAEAIGEPVAAFDTLSLVGADHVYLENPLSTDRFEMSDIAVGRPLGLGGRDDIFAESATLPFPLLPARHMWPGDLMRVYVELYGLRADSLESGYELGFRLTQLDLDGRPVSGDPVTIGIPMEGTTTRVARWIDVNLDDFEAGSYLLEVEATDLLGGESIVRRAAIEIMERR